MNIKIGDLVWTKYLNLPIGLVVETQQTPVDIELLVCEENPPYYRLLMGEDLL